MEPYLKNPACSCSRCRAGRLFGPAMIITVGALFLLDQNSYMGLDRTWPVILLVAGLFSFLSRSASTEGHVQPYTGAPVPQSGYAQSGYVQPGSVQPGSVQQGYEQPHPTPAQTPGTDTQANASTSTHNDNDTQVNS
jgi:hypothetical protein